jgi:LysR family transcriptional regulator, chromosome initiation inhibitor
MMSLDPRQLDAFAATAETGSLTTAARHLKITLAAVSLRIKALEDSLGQRLLVRGKLTRATPAGQTLMAHIKRLRLMEAEVMDSLQPARSTGKAKARNFTPIRVAINADSLGSWFLPGVQKALQHHRLLLDVIVDDQDHTLEWLKNGDVLGCVTTLAEPMRGCVSEPLGIMRYRCVASPALRHRLGLKKSQTLALAQLTREAAIVFNRKDALQDQFLQAVYGVKDINYPRHYIPAVDAYHDALTSGLGWGMQGDGQAPQALEKGELVDLFPGQFVDVPLFWQHWRNESLLAARLTQAVKEAALQRLDR